MSDPIEQLLVCEQALIAALDGTDPAAIEQAAQAVGEALERVKAIPAETRMARAEALRAALALADAGRRHTNILADRTRSRIDRLARIGGIERAPARYGRNGRLQG